MLRMGNFEERYAKMSDRELLLIAASGDELVEEAHQAFWAEVDRRGIRLRAAELFDEAVEAKKAKPLKAEPGFDPALLQHEVAEEATHSADMDEADEDEDGDEDLLEPDAPEHRDLVLIERFRDLTDAQLAQGALLSAGIDAVLCDENMVRMDWLYSNAIGGIRLAVDRENENAALEILATPAPAAIDTGDGDPFRHPECPNCRSTETFFKELDEKWSKASLWFIPVPVGRNEWHCESCGHYWKGENI